MVQPAEDEFDLVTHVFEGWAELRLQPLALDTKVVGLRLA